MGCLLKMKELLAADVGFMTEWQKSTAIGDNF